MLRSVPFSPPMLSLYPKIVPILHRTVQEEENTLETVLNIIEGCVCGRMCAVVCVRSCVCGRVCAVVRVRVRVVGLRRSGGVEGMCWWEGRTS
jgi:hypothetical protein